MTEETTSEGGTPAEGTFTVVAVPAEQAQAVIDFVAGLGRKDADVGGHMISGGLLGGVSVGAGALATKKSPTNTGCTSTGTPDPVGHDYNCSDTDTIIT